MGSEYCKYCLNGDLLTLSTVVWNFASIDF